VDRLLSDNAEADGSCKKHKTGVCWNFFDFNPQVPKLKIGSLLWKLIVVYRNFLDVFLSFKNLGYDLVFLIIQFVTFLEASYMISSAPLDMKASAFGYLGALRVKLDMHTFIRINHHCYVVF